MKNKIKPFFPYIFLISYALALPFIHLQLSAVFSGFVGVFLVVAASLLGIRAGLLAATYTSIIVATITARTGNYSADAIFGEVLAYFTISVGIGFVVEQYKVSKKELEIDIAMRIQAEDRLKYMSFHDRLTGLYNRAYFEDSLHRLDVKRQLPISIIMGDVNGLKLTNDTFGHHVGDRLLIRAAEILKESCREEDIICRWGGDEYLIILPMADNDSAQKLCNRIEEKYRAVDANPLPLSISLGVATKEIESKDIQTIIKEAEDRMYRDKLLRSKNTRSTIIGSLQSLLDEKTEETIEHSLRLQKHVSKMGKKLNVSQREMDELALLSILHDIGKIAIPDSIVMKLDKLMPDEWEIMKKHSEIGYRIASSVPELCNIAENILYHHERWDGSGYPHGLKGEEIPMLSRIVAIADSYDVMTTGRPYKQLMSHDEAVQELKKCAGSHFDPHLVEVFLLLIA